MRYVNLALLVLVICFSGFVSANSLAETSLTGITVFACNEHGTVNPALRFNSGPVDPAWDLFVARAKENPSAAPVWLNREDNRIHVPLSPGTHTFVLHFDSPGLERFMGINLFFDSDESAPGISAYVDTETAGPSPPRPNSAAKTHGLPITDIPGSGTLTFRSGAKGFWTAGLPDQPNL
ncbi:MAG: hypothetical protein U9Q79_09410, partial [Candidatus Hydrogenedentes bacterium]|nr:hypothetical protein [Candidatus Hydrogenedentota bacterium]